MARGGGDDPPQFDAPVRPAGDKMLKFARPLASLREDDGRKTEALTGLADLTDDSSDREVLNARRAAVEALSWTPGVAVPHGTGMKDAERADTVESARSRGDEDGGR